MTFQVGDKVSYNDFCNRGDSQVPAGSVILFPSGDAHVLNPDGIGFIFKTGVIAELLDLIGSEKHFTIIHIPDSYVSGRDDLAFEIYRFMSPDTTHPDAKHFRDRNTSEFWAFKAADYVLDKYGAKPDAPASAYTDDDGDRWVRNSEGSYDLTYANGQESYVFTGYTLDRLRDEHGPITAAA